MEIDQCQNILKALGSFDYVAANKLVYRVSKIYQPIGTIFTRLCHCESTFTPLQFLRSRWFVMRKDTSLEIIYHNLALELPKEVAYIDSNLILSAETKEHMKSLLEALVHLCNTRKDMINIYQAILAQSIKGDFEDILADLEMLERKIVNLHLEKHLSILGLGVEKEIKILTMLIKARKAITNYAFQDACIALYSSKQDLLEWKQACKEQNYPESSQRQDETKDSSTSTWKFSLFGYSDTKSSKQGDTWPNTIRWHTRVLENLTANMTLYFHQILLDKEKIIHEDEPERSLWKGIKIDYYDQISTFKKKFGAHCVGIIYEVTDAAPFYPQGYVLSGNIYEAPQGIHSFPFIFCHPKEPPNKHLPGIISMIQGSRTRLNDPKAEPVYFSDTVIGSTYYLMRIDSHAVMVIIYLDKHTNREPATIEFITNIVTSLRGTTVIEELIRVD
ncbi:hypothetical protein G6F46_002887 [Rhizopus delemar]|uniref:Uncharacterized protein n=2 Tax=Rhizopus TaxID=4842 RepID=A0A9P6ZAU4_9FUNG|nr:hypothetical protein G6F55_002975 [Rhizopus delemar]KAG1550724.1 hypothetical protein G6F51_002280 [Rhizopus arrhizus]KAG1500552.1 hypothetical protein G6F54_003642 [Rhizopus delemar]KAG1514101.1 hypothetical protein G6F53_003931 [Rhizopus delemar]KAG1526621.1 hypothetical protein G6F52_002267 [Rhizopus delemar]